MDWYENNRESHGSDVLNLNGEDKLRSYNNYSTETHWNETAGNKETDQEKTAFNPHWLYFFIVFAMSDFLNCGVLFVIFRSRKIRPVSYLIANLSLISISGSVIICFSVTGFKSPVFQNSVWVCRILNFIINVMFAVIPLSVMGISYERIRSLKVRVGELIVSTTLRWIWGVSIVISIPTLLTAAIVYEPSAQPACKRVLLLGNPAVGIVYEVIRFTVSNLFVSGYLAFELYKGRSKLKYLYIFQKIPTKKMRRKVTKVRFAYIYTTTFIIMWFPFGCILSFVEIMSRNSNASKFQPSSIIFDIISVLFCLYILVSPGIILCTNEDVSDWRKLFKCSKGSNSKKRNRKDKEGSNGKDNSVSVNIGPTITEAQGTTICNSISELQDSQPDEGKMMAMRYSEEIRANIFLEMPFSHQNQRVPNSSSKQSETSSIAKVLPRNMTQDDKMAIEEETTL